MSIQIHMEKEDDELSQYRIEEAVFYPNWFQKHVLRQTFQKRFHAKAQIAERKVYDLLDMLDLEEQVKNSFKVS